MHELCKELERLKDASSSLEKKDFNNASEKQKLWFIDKILELTDLVEYFCEENLIDEIHPNVINNISSNLKSLNDCMTSYQINYTNCKNFLQQLLYQFKYVIGLDLRIKKFPGYHQKMRQLKNLNEKLSQILTEIKQIDSLKNELLSANELLKNIKTSFEHIEKINAKADSLYSEVLSTENEIKELFDNIKTLHDNAFEASENIRNLENNFSRKNQEIEKLLQDNQTLLSQLHEELENYRQELDRIVEQAKRTLKWTEAAGLKTAFEKRVTDLNTEVRTSFKIFMVVTTIVIFIIIFLLFSPELIKKYLGAKPDSLFSIGRILTIGLLISLLYAFWNNWQQLRLLRDNYAHKKILAENLMIGYKTLEEDLNLDKEHITKDFLSPSMQTLLEDPVKQVYKLNLKNPFSPQNLIPKKK